jgi:hypothetical protein
MKLCMQNLCVDIDLNCDCIFCDTLCVKIINMVTSRIFEFLSDISGNGNIILLEICTELSSPYSP